MRWCLISKVYNSLNYTKLSSTLIHYYTTFFNKLFVVVAFPAKLILLWFAPVLWYRFWSCSLCLSQLILSHDDGRWNTIICQCVSYCVAATEAGQCLNIFFYLEVSGNTYITINICGRQCYPAEKVITLSLPSSITRFLLREHSRPVTSQGKYIAFITGSHILAE